MARYRSNWRRGRRRRRDVGLEHALQHIHEARQLSVELGGTDEDVKAYFFGLSASDLNAVLDAYEQEYDRLKREYAERTIPAWRSGKTHMSGLVASRLFQLLPRFMPLAQKYALVESLWAQHAPTSEYSVSFGRKADPREIRAVVERHMVETVNGHTIPEPMQRRFQWLAGGDAQAMQQMLNHFLLRDRQQAVEAVHAQVLILLRAAVADDAIQGFRRELKVGGHTVHVFLDPRATAVGLAAGSPRFKPQPDYSWLGCLGAVVVVILLIWLFSGSSSSKNRAPAPPPPQYRYHRR